MRQRDVAAPMQKYTKELADAKAENDALRDDVAAGRRRLHYQQFVSQCVKPPAASGVIRSLPPTGRPLNGIISPSDERLITMQTTGRNPRSILMSSVDRVAHIDGQLMQLL